jgi:hypothetical protein
MFLNDLTDAMILPIHNHCDERKLIRLVPEYSSFLGWRPLLTRKDGEGAISGMGVWFSNRLLLEGTGHI